MTFSVQLSNSWQDFTRLKVSRDPSAIAELLVMFVTQRTKIKYADAIGRNNITWHAVQNRLLRSKVEQARVSDVFGAIVTLASLPIT